MKGLFFLGVVCALLPTLAFSQSRKPKGPTVSVTTTFNYYPAFKPYSWMTKYLADFDDIELTYLTANSGTFVKEGETLLIEREHENHMPSQLLGIGAGVRILYENGLFQEVSLTKLSLTKSSDAIHYYTFDSLGNKILFARFGDDQHAGAFGGRYEVGKLFGKRKTAKVRFGISGGIEPSYYFYKRTPNSVTEYPIRGKIWTIDVALIPMLSAMLSKKVSLDFKLIPNILMADFGKMEENNPALLDRQKGGTREYTSPDLSLAFSVLLRYNVKEPKK
jgi:hypothetical protein